MDEGDSGEVRMKLALLRLLLSSDSGGSSRGVCSAALSHPKMKPVSKWLRSVPPENGHACAFARTGAPYKYSETGDGVEESRVRRHLNEP